MSAEKTNPQPDSKSDASLLPLHGWPQAKYFQNVEPRSKVWYWIPNGRTPTHQEYRAKRGTVVLAFATHLVCNGGNEASPHVVDDGNFITSSTKGPKQLTKQVRITKRG